MPAAMETLRGSVPGSGQDVAYISETNGYAFGVEIERFGVEIKNLAYLFDGTVRPRIEAAMADAFQKGGVPATGGKWTALTEDYAKWKTTKYQGPKGAYFPQILSLSGRMQRSLTSRGDGAVWQSRPQGFTYGTSVKSPRGFDYPTAHGTGTSRMPRRNFLEWNPRGAAGQVWRHAITVPIGLEFGRKAKRLLSEFIAVDMAGLARAAAKDGAIEERGGPR